MRTICRSPPPPPRSVGRASRGAPACGFRLETLELQRQGPLDSISILIALFKPSLVELFPHRLMKVKSKKVQPGNPSFSFFPSLFFHLAFPVVLHRSAHELPLALSFDTSVVLSVLSDCLTPTHTHLPRLSPPRAPASPSVKENPQRPPPTSDAIPFLPRRLMPNCIDRRPPQMHHPAAIAPRWLPSSHG